MVNAFQDDTVLQHNFVKGLNCSSDTYYSSQGRQDERFLDRNQELMTAMQNHSPPIASLEMETFHLFDMARVATDATLLVGGLSLALANRV